MDATAIKLVINFWHDEEAEDPCDTDGWKVYSFSTKHSNYMRPGDVEDDMRPKLEAGLAFLLSYFEHGQCLWALRGELPIGARCPWDSVGTAGIIVWESPEEDLGPKTLEERRKDAAAFIERYTHWCNGEVYGYTVEAVTPCPTCGKVEETDEVDFDLPSCGGYYPDDIDGMVTDMKDHIGDDWADYEVEFKEQHAYGVAERAEELWKGVAE